MNLHDQILNALGQNNPMVVVQGINAILAAFGAESLDLDGTVTKQGAFLFNGKRILPEQFYALRDLSIITQNIALGKTVTKQQIENALQRLSDK